MEERGSPRGCAAPVGRGRGGEGGRHLPGHGGAARPCCRSGNEGTADCGPRR